MHNAHDRSRLKLVLLAAAILIVLIVEAFILTSVFTAFSSNGRSAQAAFEKVASAQAAFEKVASAQAAFQKAQTTLAFQMLLVWSLGWLGPMVLIAFFIFTLLKYQKPLLAQAICLIAVTVNLILIFSICPMDLLASKEFKKFEDNPPGIGPDSTTEKLLIEEHKKAVEEIKNRDLEEDSWFHYKFILVGGLLAATMGYIGGFGEDRKASQESPGQRLVTLSKSPSTAVILALASVLALGVDMHIRANTCETDQLGLWIRYYVEPVAFHAKAAPDPKAKSDLSQSFLDNFRGWEEFLRESASSTTQLVDWKQSGGTSLHSDELQSLFYDPHIYFLTVFVYILYLAVFQTFAWRGTDSASDGRIIPTICFVVVQVSFFAFAWIAHSAPRMFAIKVLPFLLAYETGYNVPLHYFVPCFALVILNIPYLCLLSPNWSQWNAKTESIGPELNHSSS